MIDYGEIQVAVVIEIPGGDRGWLPANAKSEGSMERAIAVAEQRRNGAGRQIRDSEIGNAIRIEVGDGDGGRAKTYGNRRTGGGGKSAVAIGEKNAYSSVVSVGDYEIGLVIPIKIGR